MSTENKTIFTIMTLSGHNHPEKNESRPSGIITFKYILHALTTSYEKWKEPDVYKFKGHYILDILIAHKFPKPQELVKLSPKIKKSSAGK